jgi:hypothetical protein
MVVSGFLDTFRRNIYFASHRLEVHGICQAEVLVFEKQFDVVGTKYLQLSSMHIPRHD